MDLEFRIDEREFNPIFTVAAIPLLAMGLSVVLAHERWSSFVTHSGEHSARMILIGGAVCLAWHFGGCLFASGTKHKWLYVLVALLCVAPATFILPQLPFLYTMFEYPIWAIGPKFGTSGL